MTIEAPDLKAISASIESDRCILLWFARKVTDADRAWLVEAINEKIERTKSGKS